MKLEDFLLDPARFDGQVSPEADALKVERTLLECALLGIRYDAVLSTVWLLIDLKGSLFLRHGNTAVIVVKGLGTMEWVDPHPTPRGGHWSILVWEPSFSDGWRVTLRFHPSATLHVAGLMAEFHVGDIDGGDEAPPFYADLDDQELVAALPSWQSSFRPIYSTRFPSTNA